MDGIGKKLVFTQGEFKKKSLCTTVSSELEFLNSLWGLGNK
jgi:hypothetical protein